MVGASASRCLLICMGQQTYTRIGVIDMIVTENDFYIPLALFPLPLCMAMIFGYDIGIRVAAGRGVVLTIGEPSRQYYFARTVSLS